MAYQADWSKSLEYLGNCAYAGTIPSRAITRYAIIDRKRCRRLLTEARQPTITLMNYQICGSRYEEFISFIFDGNHDHHYPPELIAEREAGGVVRRNNEDRRRFK